MYYDYFSYKDIENDARDDADTLQESMNHAAEHFGVVTDMLFSDNELDLFKLHGHLEEVAISLGMDVPIGPAGGNLYLSCNIERKQKNGVNND